MDKRYDDVQFWPIDSIPNTDAGSIEERRRAFELALPVFAALPFRNEPEVSRETVLEMLEVALDEAWEALGLLPLHARDEPEDKQ